VVLFAGPAVNLPSLLIVGGTAGIKAGLLLALLVGGLAAGTALAFLRGVAWSPASFNHGGDKMNLHKGSANLIPPKCGSQRGL
jgi:hypothetical protein